MVEAGKQAKIWASVKKNISYTRLFPKNQITYQPQPAPNPGHPRKQTKFYGCYSRYGSGDALESGDVNTVGGEAVHTAPAAPVTSLCKVTGKRLTLREMSPGKSASVTLFDMSGKVVYRARVNSDAVNLAEMTGKAEGMYLAKIIYEQ